MHEEDKLIFLFNFTPSRYHVGWIFNLLCFFVFAAYGNRVHFQVDKIITPNPPVQVIDQCYDQGYGSERSPEDEMPPPLPILGVEQQYNPMIVNSVMMPHGYYEGSSQMLEIDSHQRLHQQAIQQNYDFITEGKPFNAAFLPRPLPLPRIHDSRTLFWKKRFQLRKSGKLDQKSFNFHHPPHVKNRNALQEKRSSALMGFESSSARFHM